MLACLCSGAERRTEQGGGKRGSRELRGPGRWTLNGTMHSCFLLPYALALCALACYARVRRRSRARMCMARCATLRWLGGRPEAVGLAPGGSGGYYPMRPTRTRGRCHRALKRTRITVRRPRLKTE